MRRSRSTTRLESDSWKSHPTSEHPRWTSQDDGRGAEVNHELINLRKRVGQKMMEKRVKNEVIKIDIKARISTQSGHSATTAEEPRETTKLSI